MTMYQRSLSHWHGGLSVAILWAETGLPEDPPDWPGD